MRLIDLDPRWLLKDGQRVGFIFKSPIGQQGPVWWRQTCFFAPTPFREQIKLVHAAMSVPMDDDGLDGPFGDGQPCKSDCGWTPQGPIEFETMTVTPSLDGSAGGLWHGHVTNGEIVGGI